MLSVSQLNKFYDQNHAVNDLSFVIEAGEILCLLGANGAGKTTTLNMLLGFIQPDSGSATLDGVDMHSHTSDCREHMMYIPENVHLYPDFTAIENINYLATLSKLTVTTQSIKECLANTGITDQQMSRKVGSFSKGMRQKVAIAFALLKHVKLVLMDEPTSGLDPVATQEFMDVVMSIKSRGTAILIVTHDLLCAHKLADQIGIMSQGKLKPLMKNELLSLPELTEHYFNQFSA